MTSTATKIHRVIITDDDQDDCVLFADALSELGIEPQITFAKNGDELLELLNNQALPLPNLVFLDLNMPLKNGFESLIEIKENPRLRQIPIIICSTSAQQQAVEKTYELDADLYIRKPDSFFKFKEVIGQVFSIDWAKQSKLSIEKFLISP